jgi:uncharacterized protein
MGSSETTDSVPETGRIATLDIVRGVAVLGILAMNAVDFGMPQQAYVNPLAYGNEGPLDFASWLLSFLIFDGKMRGLFTFLFGASLLLVIERAEAKAESGDSVHFRRMGWLAAIGLLHYYFIWHGDILFGYAIAGITAWFFRHAGAGRLVRIGIALILVQFLLLASGAAAYLMAAAEVARGTAEPGAVELLTGIQQSFGVPGAEVLRDTLATYRGSYAAIVAHRLTDSPLWPFEALYMLGWETTGYMLFGMAALKNGFFIGSWTREAYRRTALIGFGLSIPAYALLAGWMISTGFEGATVYAAWFAATTLVRPLAVIATAALIILLTVRGGAWVGRLAAAGRAAFTNYLGASLIMTTLFYGYGLGLYGHLSRAELWLVVLPMWGLMLLWSKPWLERFEYGPLEWLWRSLSRGKLQPMRRRWQSGLDSASS